MEECQYREINCQHCEDRITIADEKVRHSCLKLLEKLFCFVENTIVYLAKLSINGPIDHYHYFLTNQSFVSSSNVLLEYIVKFVCFIFKTHYDKDCQRIPVECPQQCKNEFPKEEV